MDYIAIGLAGFLGAVTRALIGDIVIFKNHNFPINTLIINLTGSLILSFFLAITLERLRTNPRLRLAISTGFFGSYTTFSTFALEIVNLIKVGMISTALIYIITSAVGGLVFAWTGLSMAKIIENYSDPDKKQQEAN